MKPSFYFLALLASGVASASGSTQNPRANSPESAHNATSAVAQQFHLAGYTGSFVTQAGEKVTVWHDAQDAQTATTPASTFKVFLALVALQTGVLKSAEEIVPWNGKKYPGRPEWERDLALRAAMQNSSESYFQVLAERIGQARLSTWVKTLGYGNLQLGENAKLAWHDGVFQISPVQQVDWMRRLQSKQLPIELAHQDAVEKVLADSAGEQIFSKTGTALPPQGKGLGWWVGYVNNRTNPEQSCSFALKVNLAKLDDRQERIAFGKALLRQVGCSAAN